MTPLRVLALQPYFGGSHSQFHNGWVSHSQHEWTTLSLPARHWKWRMRHASIDFAEELRERLAAGERWDVIVCTDMLNLAEFKGLIGKELVDVPAVMYFHENQFEYPNRFGKERDRHFSFTNFISALAADEIWFNSQFNFDSFTAALRDQVKKWPDFQPSKGIETLAAKMQVQPPGIDQPLIDVAEFSKRREARLSNEEPLHLIWAARWEHDKNPDDLLKALEILEDSDFSFRLSVIGQSFRTVPSVFEEIKSRFSDKIVRWGFQESREDYWSALAEADVFVSTAIHEFFGLSAAEAIAAGLFPLLPSRVAYPELLSYALEEAELPDHLYAESPESLAGRIRGIDRRQWVAKAEAVASRLLGNIEWASRGIELDGALSEFCGQ